MSDDTFIVEADQEYEIHPIALLIPGMSPDLFEKFKEDISGNGVIEPVVIWQGKILDGRHRYLACKDLGIPFDARNWEGGMDPVEYVISKNLHRRHLDSSQRAMVAARCIDYHAAEAKARQRASGGDHGNQYVGKKSPVTANLPEAGEEKQLDWMCPKCSKINYSGEDCSNCDPDKIPNGNQYVGKLQHVDNKSPVNANLHEPVNIDDKKPYASNQFENQAVSKAGKLLNVSGRSVADAKTVIEDGTPEIISAVDQGEISVSAAAKQVKERKKTTPKSTFNETTDSIEWAKWTWNPVTGCKHECQYCYARDIANRYSDAFPNGFEPTFHPERLLAPQNTKLPLGIDNGARNVFVCSMADLFGSWVDQEWIDQIIDTCLNAPQWNFIFLTKNPSRLIGIEWPENSWVGTTVDCQSRVQPAIEAFKELHDHQFRPPVMFLSCEPMNERLDFGVDGLSVFDWVIIGGRSKSSGTPAFQPEWEWVEHLHFQSRQAQCKIYWKPNLKVRPTEYPA